MPGGEGQGNGIKVKVRINVSGSRYVGFVSVLPPKSRVSDVLNEEETFMTLREVDSVDPIDRQAQLIVNKHRISYVQALEEFTRNYSGIHTGKFVPVKVRIGEYRIGGEIFLPTHLMNRDRASLLSINPYFLNVKNAVLMGTNEKYSFMAVSKNRISSIEIKD